MPLGNPAGMGRLSCGSQSLSLSLGVSRHWRSSGSLVPRWPRRPRLAQRQITSLAEPGRAGDADLGRLDPTVPRMRSCAALANGVIVALGPAHIGDRGYGLSMAPSAGVLARCCDGVRSNLRPGAVLRGAQSMKGWATPLHSRGSTTPLMATSET